MKGQTMNLNDFLAAEGGSPASYATKPVSWADEMENQADDGE